MQHGLRRIKGGFPLSLRLIREIHANSAAWRTRSEQNSRGISPLTELDWRQPPGNAAFVPPPPERMMECLDRFEHFLHDEKHKLPVLVEAGLIHVQFETIHPFLDGNGRLGRLLITLLLCAKGVLREPLLYLSLYFKTHRQRYYDLLQRRPNGGSLGRMDRVFSGRHRDYGSPGSPTQRFRFFIFSKSDRKKIRAMGRKAAS